MKLRKTLLASYGSPLMKLKVVVHKSFLPNHSKTAGDSFHYQLLYQIFLFPFPTIFFHGVHTAVREGSLKFHVYETGCPDFRS